MCGRPASPACRAAFAALASSSRDRSPPSPYTSTMGRNYIAERTIADPRARATAQRVKRERASRNTSRGPASARPRIATLPRRPRPIRGGRAVANPALPLGLPTSRAAQSAALLAARASPSRNIGAGWPAKGRAWRAALRAAAQRKKPWHCQGWNTRCVLCEGACSGRKKQEAFCL